ncbi:MAG: hypothetical protein HY673_21755 [Chloroflexi bacterium]|nr:hypothetical protein [Chloroflexota bacterium]
MLPLKRRSRQQLLALALAAQDVERRWLAEAVHDRIAQSLVGVFQQLQMLEPLAEPESPSRKLVVRATGLLREALGASRDLMNDLNPPLLDEPGLSPLIQEELHRLQDGTGCATDLAVEGERRLPRSFELAVYRIFHEALVNIKRHSRHIRRVAVNVVYEGDSVVLHILDDGGVAVPPGAERLAALEGVRLRAEIIGGTAGVSSSPGEGITVTISIPRPARSGRYGQ